MFVFTLFIFGRPLQSIIFLLRGPIQNSDNVVSSRRKGHFFITLEKKFGNALLMYEYPCLKPTRVNSFFLSNLPQALRKFFQDGSRNGSIMPPLQASRPLPTTFIGSYMGLVPLGKGDWLPFSKTFHVESSCWVPATTMRGC